MLQEMKYGYSDNEEKYFYTVLSCDKLDAILKYCVEVLKKTNPMMVGNYYPALTTDAAKYVNSAIINSAKIHSVNTCKEIDISESEDVITFLEDCLTLYKDSLENLIRLMKKQDLLDELLTEKPNYVVVLVKKINGFLNILENMIFGSIYGLIIYQLLTHVIQILFPAMKNILMVLRIFMVARQIIKYC